jgi:hypothetical protein
MVEGDCHEVKLDSHKVNDETKSGVKYHKVVSELKKSKVGCPKFKIETSWIKKQDIMNLGISLNSKDLTS